MKGITGNPALDAYQRFAVGSVSSAKAPEGASRSPAKPTSTEAAKVSISAEAASLASQDSSVDVQKVDSLKSAIASGSFQVDSTKVAERMLEHGA